MRWRVWAIPPWRIWPASSTGGPSRCFPSWSGSGSSGHLTAKPVFMRKAKSVARKLTQLGRAVAQPASPDKAKLEAVPNPHADADYVVRFTAPEFTTLCPITGQPDFAHFVIDYVPGKAILESKSLKLFLHSFRNVGSFHEATTIAIAKRIVAAIKPRYL